MYNWNHFFNAMITLGTILFIFNIYALYGVTVGIILATIWQGSRKCQETDSLKANVNILIIGIFLSFFFLILSIATLIP